MKLGEQLVAAVVAKLQAGMPARVDTINAEFAGQATPMTIVAPSNGAYFTGRMRNLGEVPALYVMEGPAKFKQEGAHGLISDTDLFVYVFESDQNGPLLAKRLQRQVRAVIETLWDDEPREALTNSAWTIQPVRTIPGTVFEPKAEDDWRGFYVVVFRAQQLESS